MTRRWILLACTIATIAAVATAAVPSLPKVGAVKVQAKVSADPATGILTYGYRLENPSAAALPVSRFVIDLRSDPSRRALSGKGLTLDPDILPSTAERIAELAPAKMVPIGIPTLPRHWMGAVDVLGYGRWGAGEDPLRPGSSVVGFVLTSRGLPGIRDAKLEADLWNHLPNMDDPKVDVEDHELVQAMEASARRVKTVGPVAPPAATTPESFVVEIQSLVEAARAEGWIRTDEASGGLRAIILRVGTAIKAGKPDHARLMIGRILSAIEEQGCREFACPPEKLLTSEAYALIRFNAEFLQSLLPPPTK